MIMGHELRVLNAMNNLVLWLIRITLGREPRAAHVMNSSRLWLT